MRKEGGSLGDARLTGAMRESGFCTWLALTWKCESRAGVADFAYLETSLGMRGYEGDTTWEMARVLECTSRLVRG